MTYFTANFPCDISFRLPETSYSDQRRECKISSTLFDINKLDMADQS